jgi:hypothetical protein
MHNVFKNQPESGSFVTRGIKYIFPEAFFFAFLCLIQLSEKQDNIGKRMVT